MAKIEFSLSYPTMGLQCFGVLSALVLALSGCTKKSEVAFVSVTLPKAIPSTSQKLRSPGDIRTASQRIGVLTEEEGPDWNSDLNPESGSELNCFAVFVGGPNLTGNSCVVAENSNFRRIEFGPNKGFLPGGAIVQMEVPAGPDRIFHVVGLRANSASACGSYDNTQIDAQNLSEPFLIASQVANVPAGESSLTIRAALDPNKKIASCSFVNGGGGGGSSDPNIRVDFGDGRDGSITYTDAMTAYLDTDMDPLNLGVSGYTFTPASGGSAGSKFATATRRVIDVVATGTEAGRRLTFQTTFGPEHFEVGDEVLFHVSSGNAVPGPPDDPTNGACGGDLYLGRFGFARIASIPTSSTVVLDRPITQTPSQVKIANLSQTIGATNFCRISINRVVNFNSIIVESGADLEIYAPLFSATEGTGGVLAVRANSIRAEGSVSIIATAQGYRGATSTASSGGSVLGFGGITGYPNGNGGGTSNAGYSGGGGGGAGEGGTSNDAVNAGVGGQPLAFGTNFPISSISMGRNHACALSNGKPYCWGKGYDGQLGIGVDGASATPLKRFSLSPVETSQSYSQISAGSDFTCGISTSGFVSCWGFGASGQLGNGTTGDTSEPAGISDVATYSKISVPGDGGSHACGLVSSTRQIKCWGNNAAGQLGNGTTTNSLIPVNVQNIGVTYQDVYTSAEYSCGLAGDNRVYCWGGNASGNFGNGTTTASLIPILSGGGSNYKKLALGTDFACGIRTDDTVHCWGAGTLGSLGNGTLTNQLSPVGVSGGFPYRDLVAGSNHACGLTTAGITNCWGPGSFGQLGDGTNASRSVPTAIVPPSGAPPFTTLSASEFSTCGVVSSTGSAYCWGRGDYGQLGSGGPGNASTPQKVRNQTFSLPMQASKVFFGGGGGHGGTGATGGSGGGFIYFMAREVIGGGSFDLVSKGQPGATATPPGGGGGGGGVVSAAIKRATVNLMNIDVRGGTGTSGGLDNPGGGGGGGLSETYICSAVSSTAFSIDRDGGIAPYNGSGAAGIDFIENNAGLCSAN